MAPDNYAVVYSDDSRRIFVIVSKEFGDFVLTKDCKGTGCGCIGCALLQATIGNNEEPYPIVDIEREEELEANLTAYPFTEEGGVFLLGLKHEKYKCYKGAVTKQRLDEIFHTELPQHYTTQNDQFYRLYGENAVSSPCQFPLNLCAYCPNARRFYRRQCGTYQRRWWYRSYRDWLYPVMFAQTPA